MNILLRWRLPCACLGQAQGWRSGAAHHNSGVGCGLFLTKKSLGQKRNYSTNNTTYSSLINLSFEEFSHWFSGFCDAESYFFISDLGNSFSFYFGINLHIDIH